MKKKLNDLMTVSQLAKMVGFTPDHVRKLLQDGKIQGEKVGNSWLISKKDAALLERKRFRRKKECCNG